MKYFRNLKLITFIFIFLCSFGTVYGKNSDTEINSPWSSYLKTTKERETPNIVLKALDYIGSKTTNKQAIELGAGIGNETEKLLNLGWSVLAIDHDEFANQFMQKRFKKILNTKNNTLVIKDSKFEDITELPNSNLILAFNSLMFMDQKKFPKLWKKITNSLNQDGIFCGSFFAPKHHLKRDKNSLPIFRLSKKAIEKLFSNYEILYFVEELQKNQKSSDSWKSNQYDHRFFIIAKKN